MLIALYFTFSGRISSLLITTIIGLPIVLVGLSSLGINFFSLYELMSHLLSKYGEEYVLGGILDAMNRTYSGLGTGMNTGPARHAFSDPTSFNPIENFYAKSIIELGIPGFIALCILFAFIALYCILAIYSQRDMRTRGMLAALAALLITIIISSLKGWQLDVDPFNLYFWLLIGVIFRHLPVNSTHATRSKAAL